MDLVISLEEDMANKAKAEATNAGIPLSDWLADLVSREIKRRQDFQAARETALRALSSGVELHEVPMPRDEAHERKY